MVGKIHCAVPGVHGDRYGMVMCKALGRRNVLPRRLWPFVHPKLKCRRCEQAINGTGR